VSQVHLDDHPDQGKTAIVIVPDDQLSLAIGREGQNARLAAKLTGWRIDIMSLTEAALASMDHLDHEAADPNVVSNEELIDKAGRILAKKEAERPITAEDYLVLDRFVAGVEGRIIDQRAAEYDAIRQERADARKSVPEAAWDLDLEELNLPLRTHNLLLENDITTVGKVMYNLELGEEALLDIKGLGEERLSQVKERMAELLVEMPELVEPAEAEEETEAEAEVAEEAGEIAEAIVEEEAEEVEAEAEAVAEVVEAEATEVAEEVEEAVEEVEETEEVEEAEEEEEEVPAIDDLSTSLVDVGKKEEKKEEKKGKVVIVSRPETSPVEEEEEEEEDEDEEARRKGKQLVYDEDAGRVVTKRKRKRGRRRPEWEDFEDMDIDEFLEDDV